MSESLPQIRLWLWSIILVLILMISVGGATRLTDSGLSITEWQLISGILPPLSDTQWQIAFDKYRTIPEYQIVNKGMSLEDFKFIYWWEWGHRFLGRMIGLLFVLPCIYFWLKGALPNRSKIWLVVLGLLGAGQGALGWYMVKSGLVDRIDVSQYRLAMHLGLAFIILATTMWIICSLTREQKPRNTEKLSRFAAPIFCLLIFIQIILGAFVAGTHSGLVYNTWPLMDGHFIPNNLFVIEPWYVNFGENSTMMQFSHRKMSYAIWILLLAYVVWLYTQNSQNFKGALVLLLGVSIQAALGIWTLLAQVPLDLALVHQIGAAIIVLIATRFMHQQIGSTFIDEK